MNESSICYKIASEPWEFDQIHDLNYRTFVEEIPQHQGNEARRLVDRFHDENVYIIALKDRELLGMLAIRAHRPFSLDQKVPDLDRFLPPAMRSLCEIRLLAAREQVRKGFVFRGLVNRLIHVGLNCGFDLALISGTLRQQKLYKHMGFVPFGPLVGSAEAPYQPMYITRETALAWQRLFPAFAEAEKEAQEVEMEKPYYFLPGPVKVSPQVKDALQAPLLSHRDPAFIELMRETRRLLTRLTHAPNVQIMMGSGTLANDVVSAHIALQQRPGIVLANGAFGERLIDHARRHGLTFQDLTLPWGQRFTEEQLGAFLDAQPHAAWLWAVHGETSCSVLNDLSLLKRVTQARGIDLYLDAVSTLGTVPVDLSHVKMASSVSGKGLASQSGLCFVFYSELPNAAVSRLPRYFDLRFYEDHQGIPFTINTNGVQALNVALKQGPFQVRWVQVRKWSQRLRSHLQEMAVDWIGDREASFPTILTIQPKGQFNARRIGDELAQKGFLVSYLSEYLLKRDWLQCCFMSYRFTNQMIDSLAAELRPWLR